MIVFVTYLAGIIVLFSSSFTFFSMIQGM